MTINFKFLFFNTSLKRNLSIFENALYGSCISKILGIPNSKVKKLPLIFLEYTKVVLLNSFKVSINELIKLDPMKLKEKYLIVKSWMI